MSSNKLICLLIVVTGCNVLVDAVGTGSTEEAPRIIGGEIVRIKDYPYQVAIKITITSTHDGMCGGSIISKDWVLTAAHCSTDNPPSRYRICYGSSFYFLLGFELNVTEIIINENYDNITHDYDYALMKVETPFIFRAGVAAIPLPEQDQDIEPGSIAIVSGWGNTKPDDHEILRVLYALNMTVVSTETCGMIFGSQFTSHMICAGVEDETYKGACGGDSGGPMVVAGQLVGVTSKAVINCNSPHVPSIFAKVSLVRNWIRDKSGV